MSFQHHLTIACLQLSLAVSPACGEEAHQLASSNQPQTSWSHQVKLPGSEAAMKLFNGEDLDGWNGIDTYFSVVHGTIRAANDQPVAESTYLSTEREVRDFRLLMEVKQTRGQRFSKMHSAVAFGGERVTDRGGDHGHKGPILMFCHDWGIWEAGGRGRVYPADKKGPITNAKYENQGEWNRLEILVLGNRVRMVTNGQLMVDHMYKPDMLQEGPLGLQLHRNNDPQEYHFRGLVLVDSPTDQLLTVGKEE